MKNNIDIYWFSGTGNSFLVAKNIQNFLTKKKYSVNMIPIEKTDRNNIKLNMKNTIGIVIPVAMQGTYPIIWDFIKSLPISSENTEVFLFDTLKGYSGGLLGPVKSILIKKGYKPLGAKEIKMPSNFIRKKEITAREKEQIKNSENEIQTFCQSLINNNGSWPSNTIISYMLSMFSRSTAMQKLYKKMMPIKIFETKCIKCQTCIKICPVNNLKIKPSSDVPKPQNNCILCHRCLAFCPANAISIGKKETIQYHSVQLTELFDPLKQTKGE